MTANCPTGRPAAIRFSMGGHEFTCKQLADLAGCSPQTMHRRLARGMVAAAAVAWGPADRNRARPNAPASVTVRPGKFEMAGQRYTCRALASMAGCSVIAMRSRLRTLSPAEAVARGAADSHRRRKADDDLKTPVRPSRMEPKPPKPPKPAKVKQTKPPASAKLSAKSWSIGEKKADKRVLKPTEIKGEAIVTPKTVVTVAPTPMPRFAVTHAPSTFGRIGQYEDTGSAIARQYGA